MLGCLLFLFIYVIATMMVGPLAALAILLFLLIVLLVITGIVSMIVDMLKVMFRP